MRGPTLVLVVLRALRLLRLLGALLCRVVALRQDGVDHLLGILRSARQAFLIALQSGDEAGPDVVLAEALVESPGRCPEDSLLQGLHLGLEDGVAHVLAHRDRDGLLRRALRPLALRRVRLRLVGLGLGLEVRLRGLEDLPRELTHRGVAQGLDVRLLAGRLEVGDQVDAAAEALLVAEVAELLEAHVDGVVDGVLHELHLGIGPEGPEPLAVQTGPHVLVERLGEQLDGRRRRPHDRLDRLDRLRSLERPHLLRRDRDRLRGASGVDEADDEAVRLGLRLLGVLDRLRDLGRLCHGRGLLGLVLALELLELLGRHPAEGELLFAPGDVGRPLHLRRTEGEARLAVRLQDVPARVERAISRLLLVPRVLPDLVVLARLGAEDVDVELPKGDVAEAHSELDHRQVHVLLRRGRVGEGLLALEPHIHPEVECVADPVELVARQDAALFAGHHDRDGLVDRRELPLQGLDVRLLVAHLGRGRGGGRRVEDLRHGNLRTKGGRKCPIRYDSVVTSIPQRRGLSARRGTIS